VLAQLFLRVEFPAAVMALEEFHFFSLVFASTAYQSAAYQVSNAHASSSSVLETFESAAHMTFSRAARAFLARALVRDGAFLPCKSFIAVRASRGRAELAHCVSARVF
jgi:hypothetical protein